MFYFTELLYGEYGLKDGTSAFGSPAARRRRIMYTDLEQTYKNWYNIYQWTFGGKQICSLDVGAKGLENVMIKVVQDGWVLEMTADVDPLRTDLEELFGEEEEEAFEEAAKHPKGSLERKIALEAYNFLVARKAAAGRHLAEQEVKYKEEFGKHVFRIELLFECEKDLTVRRKKDDDDNLLAFKIDLYKKEHETFVKAVWADGSPAKK